MKIIPFLNGIYSQWHQKQMTLNGVVYNCCEQYMMAQKAILFDDQQSLRLIMKTNDPKKQKELGRNVNGFNEKIWRKKRYQIVLAANFAKFSQNNYLKEKLLATNDAILVEGNPHDNIWGVGLKKNDKRIYNPKNWKGLNLLGQALMEVRSMLKENEINTEATTDIKTDETTETDETTGTAETTGTIETTETDETTESDESDGTDESDESDGTDESDKSNETIEVISIKTKKTDI